jgi:hypothetical protein
MPFVHALFICATRYLVNGMYSLLPLRSSPSTFVDLYVVFEFMNMDLSKLGKDTAQTLSLYHVQWFMYEVSIE